MSVGSPMLCFSKYFAVGSRPPKYNRLLRTLSTKTTTTISPFRFKSSSHQKLHLLLEKCSTMRELKVLHAQIILHGLCQENLTLGKVISFCAVSDTGDLHYAQLVFDNIREPNKFMFNSLIRGYCNSQEPAKAIFLYRQMLVSGHLPNEFTLPFVFKACACKLACRDGMIVHGQAIKLVNGFQVCVQNALMSFYVAFGLIGCARKVFDDIPERTLVSWNSMIGGYSKISCSKDAFSLFEEMRELAVETDEFTFVNLLSVCSQTFDLNAGRYVHKCMVTSGITSDVYVNNALMDMYAKCGCLNSAKTVFDRMPHRNVVSWTSLVNAYASHGLIDVASQVFEQMPVKNAVSWNSMISCLIQEGQCKDALDLFTKMCTSKVLPDEATLIASLSACSQLGDLVMGRRIHDYINSSNIRPNVALYNSLVDMYAKCGPIGTALEIFHEMPEKNLVSWNVIIGALAVHGHGFKANQLFEQMWAAGIRPDEITFTGLLSACSHSGLVDLGRHYFDQMAHVYKVSLEIEHYACMVDLFGRGGLLKEAITLVAEMPMKPDLVVWGALLGACRIQGSSEIAKQILKQILALEPFSGGLYVLMSNIYSEAQRWDDVKKIWVLMKDRGIKKSKAISSIEVDGHVHEFMVEDKTHGVSDSIYLMLDQLTDHLRSFESL